MKLSGTSSNKLSESELDDGIMFISTMRIVILRKTCVSTLRSRQNIFYYMVPLRIFHFCNDVKKNFSLAQDSLRVSKRKLLRSFLVYPFPPRHFRLCFNFFSLFLCFLQVAFSELHSDMVRSVQNMNEKN